MPASRAPVRRNGTGASGKPSSRFSRSRNPDRIYLGGGNAKHVTIDLPPHIQIASNTAGLLGGIALWDGREGIELSKAEKATQDHSRRVAHPDQPLRAHARGARYRAHEARERRERHADEADAGPSERVHACAPRIEPVAPPTK